MVWWPQFWLPHLPHTTGPCPPHGPVARPAVLMTAPWPRPRERAGDAAVPVCRGGPGAGGLGTEDSARRVSRDACAWPRCGTYHCFCASALGESDRSGSSLFLGGAGGGLFFNHQTSQNHCHAAPQLLRNGQSERRAQSKTIAACWPRQQVTRHPRSALCLSNGDPPSGPHFRTVHAAFLCP